ncbi:ABC transporter transmembrane domain-containing protein [Magnetovibrio sp. PR-2]|uniref:peptidase domain-containing ABC transporter n=1 Tax=Magnetovibrio sp. PR-2 TaxID=3120356 RepID=UPI002FCE11AE
MSSISSDTNAAPAKRASFLRSLFRVSLGRYDVLLASLAINIFSLALPLVILQVYDKIVPNSAYNTFAYLVAGLAAAIILDAVLRGLRTHITSWEGARFEHAISQRAADRLLNSRLDAYESEPAGTHMDRMTSVEALRDFHSGQGLVSFSDLPFVILFLGIIGAININLVLAPLAVVLLAFGAAIWLSRKLDQAIKHRADLDEQRYSFIFQVLNGIHTVKGLGLEAQLHRQYQSLLAPLSTAVEQYAYLSSLGRSLGPAFSNLSMAAVATFGSLMVLDGTLSSGALIASTLLAGRAVQPLIRIIGVWMQSQNLKLAEERLDTLMNYPLEPLPRGEQPAEVDWSQPIRFDEVTVHRGNPDFPVLKNFSLEIPAGSVVALTGPMGGGKSVVLDALAGLAHVDEGELLFGEHSAAHIDFQKLRNDIAYARQDVVMYDGTISDNLSGFQKRKHLPEALTVAHKLGLDEEIARMPDGLDTNIGSSATVGLPGSIQQEISLCRALSKPVKLLLFDEANSVFDFEADKRLRRMLIEMKGKVTLVLITSRPSLIALADQVLTIDRGRITEYRQNQSEPETVTKLQAPGGEGGA